MFGVNRRWPRRRDVAMDVPLGALDWQPFVNVAHVRVRTDAFGETGGHAA
jgi:uncharacterized protein with beta-barrel porin domain